MCYLPTSRTNISSYRFSILHHRQYLIIQERPVGHAMFTKLCGDMMNQSFLQFLWAVLVGVQEFLIFLVSRAEDCYIWTVFSYQIFDRLPYVVFLQIIHERAEVANFSKSRSFLFYIWKVGIQLSKKVTMAALVPWSRQSVNKISENVFSNL